MERVVTISVVVGAVALLAGAAFAQMGWGHGPGMMGTGSGAGPGQYAGCPGAVAGAPAATPVTEENAKQIAQQYADKYLKGYTVDAVLPFTGITSPGTTSTAPSRGRAVTRARADEGRAVDARGTRRTDRSAP